MQREEEGRGAKQRVSGLHGQRATLSEGYARQGKLYLDGAREPGRLLYKADLKFRKATVRKLMALECTRGLRPGAERPERSVTGSCVMGAAATIPAGYCWVRKHTLCC